MIFYFVLRIFPKKIFLFAKTKGRIRKSNKGAIVVAREIVLLQIQ
jgi:hypothetical protein